MEPPGGRDSRFNLGYNMNLLSGETSPEIYGNPNLGRPSTSLQQLSPRHTMVSSACNRGLKSDIYDERGLSGQSMGLDSCVNEINEDSYSMQSKKSPPSNGKKTKGRVKIKMEYIENKLRRYTTFSKRKTGIMKKAYELSTLTGTQVMLLVASETGHVYTFATRKLQPMITSEAGKALIQTCLNSPDPPAGSAGGDQRMSATGFEETELTYNISDDDSKDGESGSESSSDEIETTEDTIDFQETHQQQIVDEDPLAFSSLKPGPDSLQREECLVNPKTNNIKKSESEQNKVHKERNEDPQLVTSSIHTNNIPGLFPLTVNSTTSSTTNLPLTTTINTIPSPMEPSTINCTIGSSVIDTSVGTIQVNATTGASPGTLLGVTSTISNGNTSSRLQALPLVLQTPAGIGYATTPDGMILGMLQGPNITQPQLVAIPMPVTSIIGTNTSCSKNESTSEAKKKRQYFRW